MFFIVIIKFLHRIYESKKCTVRNISHRQKLLNFLNIKLYILNIKRKEIKKTSKRP